MKRFILRIGLGIVMGGLLWGGLSANPARAATIQYSFNGPVNHVNNQLNPPFGVNVLNPMAMSGFMTVNTSELMGSPPNFGEYTIENFSLNILNGSNTLVYTATKGSFNQVEIRNGLPGQDQFNVAVIAPIGAPATVGTRSPSSFEIELHGPDSIFSSDALPTTSPSISAFSDKNIWRLVFVPGENVVSGTVMSMTVVPLPAAVILFGAGLVALVGLGAGSWRKRNNSLA